MTSTKIGKKEPYLEALKEIKRSAEVQAPICVSNCVVADYYSFNGVAKELGNERAGKLHKRVWRLQVKEIIPSVREKFEIWNVKDIPALADVVKYVFELIPRRVKIVEKTPNRAIIQVSACPFVAYLKGLFKEKPGSPYFKSMSSITEDSVRAIAEELGMGGRIRVRENKAMCLGDDVCEVICELK